MTAAASFGEHHLVQRIKERFCMPEFATLANVGTPSGTFADAIAVNLWRSRGYEIVGFEVKSFRSDWLRELKDPKKAEGCAIYCNTFWIVANENVVKLEELPLGWGLLEPFGKTLRSMQKAKPLDHKRELTVPFMINMIRRAVEKGEMTEELNAAREAGRQAGLEEGVRRSESRDEISAREKLGRFEHMHAEFKERTGIEITDWVGGKELLAAYTVAHRIKRIPQSLGYAIDTLKRETRAIEAIVKVVEEATK
jgi:hypothetical protein